METGRAWQSQDLDQMAWEIEQIIDAQEYRTASWGILFEDIETGEAAFERNPDILLRPASTTKLYSVAAALDTFGADHRFETTVYRRGEVADGVLNGDLILVFTGDLTLGGRTDEEGRIAFLRHDHTYGPPSAQLTAQDPLAGLNALATEVYVGGIKRITGDVLIDDRLFDTAQSTGSGPARLTPVVINDNMIDITVRPGEVGALATVTIRPVNSLYVIDARVETVPAGEETKIEVTAPIAGRLVVRGRIAADAIERNEGHEVEDAPSFARSLFIEALLRQGVQVDASPLGVNRPSALPPSGSYRDEQRVAAYLSPTLAEEAKLILKVSHNLHASILPLLVAVKNGKRTLADGLKLQGEFLERLGLDRRGFSFGGGAGGDAADMTTARSTVALLRAMTKHKDFPAYLKGQPVLGVDGTLTDAVPSDSPARGKAQAKTGTLYVYDTLNDRHLLTCKSLAGYLTTASGHRFAFAILVNNIPMKEISEATEFGKVPGKICEIVHNSL